MCVLVLTLLSSGTEQRIRGFSRPLKALDKSEGKWLECQRNNSIMSHNDPVMLAHTDVHRAINIYCEL